ncbi:MAG: argininosuccinate lyase, partial [Campylobacterota bacterium]|nr:argininosuccinate lyase [Campylobacterota bacterium]
TKDVVVVANKLNKDISQLNLEEIRGANKKLENIDEEILKYLDLRNSMNARDSFGGTNEQRTKEQISYFRDWLNR